MLERTSDMVLKNLIELAVASLDLKRPVFPNLLDTPVLWRKFLVAVKEARNDAQKAREQLEQNIPDLPHL